MAMKNRLLALLFPILVAVLLTGFIPQRPSLVIDQRLQLQRVEVGSVAELEAAFERLDYQWPPQQSVPPLEVLSLPPDLAQVADVQRRKSLFFRALLPIVLAENEKLAELRGQIVQLLDKGVVNLADAERRWLEAIARQQRLDGDLLSTETQRRLLRRVDMVPPALVLAQAANESAWGTSRFARLGNNLFGQWTYQESQGIVPLGRPEGARYAVRAFGTIDASVRGYLRNINTHPAYRELRLMRERMRGTGEALDAHQLATGLAAYSARGEAYIDELQLMMRGNRLEQIDSLSLDRGGEAVSPSRPDGSTAG